MSDDDIKTKRAGNTVVTSVSVSPEFSKLIEQYNMSATECFRRGVAVTLFDLGVGMYQSPKNEARAKYMQEFLGKLEHEENLKKEYEKILLRAFMNMSDKDEYHLISISSFNDNRKSLRNNIIMKIFLQR
jgi:hypothetical protein